jgi:WD40 repeat protein/transcriptional regulator with XRE-family HTH domain/energy-coupling factor transporter ATP-binding protein EcfA2
MQYSDPISIDTFTTFGDLLKYLRRRETLTQLELSIEVGYSEAQISRLEKNQRLPDPTGVKALFIPALHLEENPQYASRLVELAQEARQVDSPSPGMAPYKGLLYFDEPDAELFFGREAITGQLAQHVLELGNKARRRFLAVVGASGSGKSSLVRAGLAVALRKVGWEVLVFTPSVHPQQVLEAQINRLHQVEASRVLILVDQFEEAFTLCRDELERIGFIEQLLSYAQEKSKQYSVVIALRADFYAHCSQYPLLRQTVAAEQEYIGQMTMEELRQAIEEPARRNGWELEPGLVDVMLQDLSMHGSHEPEPGALPLLSHALLATWEHRRGRVLTLSGYHASGGVRGAIAETAESVFTDQLNQSQQEIAREVFLRLTELGEGTEDTRRRAALAELGRQYEQTAQFRAVLNTLAEARLITLNEDSAEVAHEALIREWQRLHEWLTQDREGLLLHRHLTEAAQEWERRGRDAAELYRGARLAQASEWAGANPDRLNQAESDFLAASVEQEQHEALEREAQRQRELDNERQRAEEHQQAAQRLRRRAYQLGGVLAVALILAAAAVLFGRQARINSRLATARELAAAAVNNLEIDQDRSLLLAMQAVKTVDLPEAETALHQAILADRLRATFNAHDDSIYGIAIGLSNSKAAGNIATAGIEGTIKVWELDKSGAHIDETPLITISNPMDFDANTYASGFTLAYSPDGKLIAAISDQNTAKIWDATNGRLLQTLAGHKNWILGLAFSPNGEFLATSSADRTAKVWDPQTGELLQTLTGFRDWVITVVFSQDGKRLACGTMDGSVIVFKRNEESNTPPSSDLFVPSFEIDNHFTAVSGIFSITFSPDGNQLALASNEIKVYDINSVTPASPPKLFLNIPAHHNPINGLYFSADGNRLVSGSGDGTAKVWDAQTGQLSFTLPGNAGPISSIAQSADGLKLYTSDTNGHVKVWDISVQGNREWLTNSNISLGFYTRSGNRLVTVDYFDYTTPNSKLRVLELSPENVHEISAIYLGRNVENVSFDIDQKLSRLVLIYHDDYIVHVLDFSNGHGLISFPVNQTQNTPGHTKNDYIRVKLSPDGTRLVTGGSDGSAFLWDVTTGKLLHELPGQTGMFGSWDPIAFNPDGSLVACASVDGTVRIWNVNTGTLLQNLPGSIFPNVSFSPDGKHLLATGEENTINLWDIQTGQILHKLTVPTLIYNIEISPDGKYLAADTLDGIVRLWDANTGQQLLTLPGAYMRFTKDMKHLLVWKDDGNFYGYILDIDELMDLARTRLTRTWTQEECEQFLHTEVCPPTP